VLPAPRIDFCMSVAVTGGNSIFRVAAVGESKGMSPTSAEFVRRLQSRISRFLLMSAAWPACRFSRSVNRGLQ
jgi:hypothetical protein